jgi:hypothetical protein
MRGHQRRVFGVTHDSKFGADGSKRERWLTPAEAAKYIQLRPRTLLAKVRSGDVIGHCLSGSKRKTWRFRESELDASLRRPENSNKNRVILRDSVRAPHRKDRK